MAGDATQDRFLGAILGMAIGDAFGMPVAGWSRTTIEDFHGTVTDYLPRTFPDGEAVNPGEITDETEFALCIIESFTAGQGTMDVENIGIRMSYLARADSRRWMSAEVAAALDGASEAAGFQLPLVDDEVVGADILARGIPIGLMHSMGALNDSRLRSEVELVTRVTHGSPLACSLVEAVARAMSHASRQSRTLNELKAVVAEELPDGEVRTALLTEAAAQAKTSPAATLIEAIEIASAASTFDDVLQRSVAPGGPADARAALAGALFAGHKGSSVIPQRFIDGLESRIYVSLAVPWFYRTVARRSGRVVDIRSSAG